MGDWRARVQLGVQGGLETTQHVLEGVVLGRGVVTASPRPYRAFTPEYFRENLAVLTGGPPGEGVWQAHHVVPQEFHALLRRIGIRVNFNDPRYGAWLTRRNMLRFTANKANTTISGTIFSGGTLGRRCSRSKTSHAALRSVSASTRTSNRSH